MVVEIDGNSHATPEGQANDRERDAYLAENGVLVLRFWNTEVKYEEDAVLDRIADVYTDRARPGKKG